MKTHQKKLKFNIEDYVNNYSTKNEQGFINKEIYELVKYFPDIKIDKFEDALRGNTGMLINGECITYHCDIIKALKCGLENRILYWHEWD